MTQTRKEKKFSSLLEAARLSLLTTYPFLGSCILQFPVEIVKSLPNDAPAATDGRGIYFCIENFPETFPLQDLTFVLAHELFHIIFEHLQRRKARDPLIWALAADIITNVYLVREFDLPFPRTKGLKGVWKEDCYKKSVEEVYEELYKKRDNLGGFFRGLFGDKSFDAHLPFPDNVDQTRHSEEIKSIVAQAANLAQSKGKLPSGIEEMIQAEILETDFSWIKKFKATIGNLFPIDRTWTRPSRRGTSIGLYLPGILKSPEINLVVVIDTSGSTIPFFETFWGAILSLKHYNYVGKIRVIQIDAKVQKDETFNLFTLPKAISFKGTGGTDFKEVFDLLEQDRNKYPVLFLTDLCAYNIPKKPPRYPLLWVLPYKISGGPNWGDRLVVDVGGKNNDD